MDDIDAFVCEKLQGFQDLLCKFPDEVDGNSIELGVFQEFI